MSAPSSGLDSDGTQVNHGLQAWGFIVLFGFILPALALQSLWSDPSRTDTWLAVATLLPVPLAWALLAEARMQIRVSGAGLDVRPLWGTPTRQPWSGIRSVRYRGLLRVLELQGPELPGGILRVSLMRRNVGALASLIRDRAPEGALEGEARRLLGPRR